MKFFIVATILQAALGYNSETHLVLTRIGYDILFEQSPSSLAAAEDLLAVYADTVTELKEGNFQFVEGSTWADDIKYRGGGWQSNWHFVTTHWINDGSAEEDLSIKNYAKNISLALPMLSEWLSGVEHTENEDLLGMKESITSRSNGEQEAKSMALRLLIHFMGDVHQPLHDMNLYSQVFPKGDKGGNDVELKYHYTVKNLHSLWDTTLYKFRSTVKRPFTSDSFAKFGTKAEELRRKVEGTLTREEIETTDFETMIAESVEIAPQLYDDIISAEYPKGHDELVVPESYLEHWMPVAEKRVVLAAHRLAYLIDQIFSGTYLNTE